MTQTRAEPRSRAFYLEIFLVSFAALMLEISYTRLISFKLFYYYTYLIIGLALLSHASNLFLFTVGGLTRGQAPLIPKGSELPGESYADPLPQALILTAIVIGFGLQAFALLLFKKVYQTVGSDDLDDLKATELGS